MTKTVEVTKQPTRYVSVTQKQNVTTVVQPATETLEVHDPGVAGPPNSLTVGTVVTGEEPAVTITGIAPNQVINFTIPVGGAYMHTQYSSSNRWEITHNLMYNPNVTVVDSAGTLIEGSIEYLSPNSIVLLFSAPFAGKAYLS
jgi:hypothetical protein